MQFLAQETRNADQQGYVSFLNTYVNTRLEKDIGISQRHEAMLLHDEMEAVNQPVYFHEFAEHAATHGLQYVTESEFPKVMTHKFSPQAVERLNQMSHNIIEFEQYLDFLGNRTLRQTLLCHADLVVQRRLQPEKIDQLYIASVAQPLDPELDITSKTPVKFGTSDGAVFTTDHPLTKAALYHLTKYSPKVFKFDVLVSSACVYLEIESPSEADVQFLAASLLQAFTYSMQLVELHAYLPALTIEISEKPIGSPFARFQAKGGARVTNLRHERVDLDAVSHIVLQCLNGQHDRESLVDVLMTLLEKGAIRLTGAGKLTHEQLLDEVERSLRWLAGVGLLVG
jgi:methyltransferase-like protein